MKKLMLLVTIAVVFCAAGCRPAVEPGPEGGMFLTAKWLIAKGAPDASAGVDGDLYLDTETTELYVKTEGVWVSVAALQGAAGISGSGWLVAAGVPGESLGEDGDLYLDTDSTTAYVKSDGTWTELFALQGEPGSPGSPGSAGADGATWFTGSGDPNEAPPADATVDDLYLDTQSAIIYKNTGSGWSPIVYFQALGTPRIVFTPHDAGINNMALYGIAYGNELFVVVGATGTVITSSDGTDWNWEQQALRRRIVGASGQSRGLVDDSPSGGTISSTLYGVAYGNGMFVAVSTAGAAKGIYSSVDGSSWTAEDWELVSGFQAFRSIAYVGGKFIAFGDWYAGGDQLLVVTSTDGVSWTEGSVPSTYEHFSAPVLGGSVYVSVGDQGTVMTSATGTSWADTGDFTSTITPLLYAVAYANGTFVAVGYESDNEVSLILLSSDGITWTTQDVPLAQNVRLFGVTSGTAGFVAVGHDSVGTGGSVVLTSANGRSWAAQRWDHKARSVGWGPMDDGLYAVVVDY